jgi:RNA polymerase sigma-B factor
MVAKSLDAPRAPAQAARYDNTALLERYHRDREPADRDALVERFLPLALHLSRKYHASGEREDLEQVASIGLLKALDRFDPSRGIAFSSFAVPTILGELKRYFRDLGWSVHVPRSLKELAQQLDGATDVLTRRLGRAPTPAELAEHCETTTERVMEAHAVATAHRADSLDAPVTDGHDRLARVQTLAQDEAGFAQAERTADLDRLLAALPQREQLILRLRFREDLTQREIADRVGLSQMHVSRLIRAAIDQLNQMTRTPPVP